MKSIDNLREYVLTAPSICSTTRAILVGYVDGIDREAMEERTAAYNEGYDAGFASADDWAAQHEDAMAEHGWVRLPVDADGVPIHVGDVLDEGKVAKVVLTDEHWEPSVYVYKLPNVQHEYFCNEVAHYHAPTVEGVLLEFAERWHEGKTSDRCYDFDATIAEYAKRLRLAGGEDA